MPRELLDSVTVLLLLSILAVKRYLHQRDSDVRDGGQNTQSFVLCRNALFSSAKAKMRIQQLFLLLVPPLGLNKETLWKILI